MAGNRITDKIYQIIGESVLAIDVPTSTVEATISVGTNPVCLDVNCYTNRIYAVNNGSNNVSAIDGETNTVIKTYGVGQGPTFIRVALKNNKLWVANSAGDSVTCIVDNGKLRLWGQDRFRTAAAISEYGWESSDYVVLSKGADFPDALAAAPIAGAEQFPILLTRAGHLPDNVKQALHDLGITKTLVVGGPDVVADNVFDWLKDNGYNPERLYGNTRYDTCKAVTEYGLNQKWITMESVGIGFGENFPDALALGPFMGMNKGPVLLCRETFLPDPINQLITAHKDEIHTVYIAGGTDVISEAVDSSITNIVGF